MAFHYDKKDPKNVRVRWKNGPWHTGPDAFMLANKEYKAELKAEAVAHGYTGPDGHLRYHAKKKLEQEKADRMKYFRGETGMTIKERKAEADKANGS